MMCAWRVCVCACGLREWSVANKETLARTSTHTSTHTSTVGMYLLGSKSWSDDGFDIEPEVYRVLCCIIYILFLYCKSHLPYLNGYGGATPARRGVSTVLYAQSYICMYIPGLGLIFVFLFFVCPVWAREQSGPIIRPVLYTLDVYVCTYSSYMYM